MKLIADFFRIICHIETFSQPATHRNVIEPGGRIAEVFDLLLKGIKSVNLTEILN